MNKNFIKLVLIFGLFNLGLSNTLNAKENLCKVMDPTGTPLNVRDKPYGRVVNRLPNGREVYIERIDYDHQNRPWALISGAYNGEYKKWGWVYREFISCYSR